MKKNEKIKITIEFNIDKRFIKGNVGAYISKELDDNFNRISSKADVSKSELVELAGRKLFGLPIDHLPLKNFKIAK
ncbi:MAG: hypothetical protein J0M18_21580 [Ignavibacteria bacterium]|nr:hypothetical protein [Ignavibacteria bacterium]